MAERVKEMVTRYGLEFFIESPTNQQFVVVTGEQLKKIQKKVRVSVWEQLDDSRWSFVLPPAGPQQKPI